MGLRRKALLPALPLLIAHPVDKSSCLVTICIAKRTQREVLPWISWQDINLSSMTVSMKVPRVFIYNLHYS